jgi:hypothetical protein
MLSKAIVEAIMWLLSGRVLFRRNLLYWQNSTQLASLILAKLCLALCCNIGKLCTSRRQTLFSYVDTTVFLLFSARQKSVTFQLQKLTLWFKLAFLFISTVYADVIWYCIHPFVKWTLSRDFSFPFPFMKQLILVPLDSISITTNICGVIHIVIDSPLYSRL